MPAFAVAFLLVSLSAFWFLLLLPHKFLDFFVVPELKQFGPAALAAG